MHAYIHTYIHTYKHMRKASTRGAGRRPGRRGRGTPRACLPHPAPPCPDPPEGERESVCVCMCVCVCERERARELVATLENASMWYARENWRAEQQVREAPRHLHQSPTLQNASMWFQDISKRLPRRLIPLLLLDYSQAWS